MTQAAISFYTGAAEKFRTACLLANKAMQSGLRVLILTPDEAATAALDRMLWTYPGIAFMPHGRLSGDLTLPVLVDHQLSTALPHQQVLINLCPATPDCFGQFARVIEIVGQDDDDKQAGRARFAAYREGGLTPVHFDLSKNEGV